MIGGLISELGYQDCLEIRLLGGRFEGMRTSQTSSEGAFMIPVYDLACRLCGARNCGRKILARNFHTVVGKSAAA
jgi:hypothetical protein